MRRQLAALALATLLPLPSLAAEVLVKPGETLSDIAERHGVSVTQLMQRNGIKDPNLVMAGTKLVLPSGSRPGSSGGGGQASTHVVKPGETLSHIAERHGLSASRLMQINGIKDPNLVVAGTRLSLRPTASRSAAGASASRGAGPTVRYTVRDGETLSEIADRHGLSTVRLMQINGIKNPNLVFAGSQMVVPAPKTASKPTPPPPPARPSYNRQAKEHVVRSGETLSDIADGYKLPLERLIAINNIKDPNTLISGTRLKLRQPPAAAKPAAPVARKPAAKPVAKPAPAPVAVQAPVAAAAPQATAAALQTPRIEPQAVAAASFSPATATSSTPTATAPTATTTPTATLAEQTSAAVSPIKPSIPASRPIDTVASAPRQPRVQPAVQPAQQAATQPKSAAAAKPAAAGASKAVVATASSSAGAAKPATPDWRSYGPLQIDWANWHPMGGSFVAPSLNRDGQPLYLAVNCSARKLNATSQAGQWKTWDTPQTDFENQLVNDICKQKGS
ncbi:MAG: LysM peptidoglycan-binding domain-containing protein [Prochlorococcaceae cyanobacterium]